MLASVPFVASEGPAYKRHVSSHRNAGKTSLPFPARRCLPHPYPNAQAPTSGASLRDNADKAHKTDADRSSQTILQSLKPL